MRPDWTVPFDDILTTRFRTCQWCSEPADRLELWCDANAEATAIAACRRCLETDGDGARRNAVVERQVQQRAQGH
jgi:hypothetical protein